MAHGDINHVELPVSDFAAATEFYRSLFGWDIAESPGFEGYPMWRAPNGVSGGGLVQREGDSSQPRIIIEVDSIDDTLLSAQEMGGRVIVEKAPITENSAWAVFLDPDGNVIGVFEGTTES